MASTVMFTGAGASKPFGFPLTKDILPRIRDSKDLFDGFRDKDEDRDSLNKYLQSLLPGYKQAKTLPYITDVLSLIDHALLAGVNPLKACCIEDLARFRELVEKAIYDILWPPYKESRAPYAETPPPPLLELGVQLGAILNRGETVNLITTNYDTAIDSQLFQQSSEQVQERFDFGFTWRDPHTGQLVNRPSKPMVRIYKLHGSVAWLRCELCEHTYINRYGPIGGHGFSRTQSDSNTCHCLHWPLRPVLVTPSLVRSVRDVNLLEIWKNSLELLRAADRWLIVGYSFPPEDVAIRSLFLRAYRGHRSEPEVTVVQHREDVEMQERYRLFFPKCKFYTNGFESYIPMIGGV